ncbi:MAG: hypothetical protein ACR2LK_06285 [Solirubrobacteraceae bacterium]
MAISLSGAKQYDATVKLLVGGQDEPINSLLDPNSARVASDPERDVNTAVEIIKAGGTASAVRAKVIPRRSEDDLLDQIAIDSNTSSSIVSLRARDPDPRLAARIANAFAQSYVDFRLDSARKRYQEAASLAATQLQALSAGQRAAPEGRALEARQRELQIAGALQTGGAEIIRGARVPRDPSRPRPVLSTALGGVLGLLLGGAAALLLGVTDRRLTTEESIESLFELPVLGTIPPPARRGSSHEEHIQREAFGLLASKLRYSSPGDGGKVIMITSPSPGEGKTSVTLGLARAFALLGLRVIAIEADLRRPAFARYATLGSSPGLAGVLAGEVRLSEAIVLMDAEKLAPMEEGSEGAVSFGLLPAGTLPGHPQRALSSPSMLSTLRVARAIADLVIVDTAPVGTVNDAAALLHAVDTTAVVVRLGATTNDLARRALRVLRGDDIDLAGLIITDAAQSDAPGYYYEAPPVTRAKLQESDPEVDVESK